MSNTSPAALVGGGSTTDTAVLATKKLPPPHYSSSGSTGSSVVVVILIIASAIIVTASIYILLRFFSRRYRRTFSASEDVVLRHDGSPRFHAVGSLLDNLPLFTFRSVNGDLAGGDCAVCLSKFDPDDQLRLLPLCCHAFHAACIDTWIVTSHTCPLCRSAVLPSDADDFLDKMTSSHINRRIGSNSFQVEIGSISGRGEGVSAMESGRRSYSIGSFEYILDCNGLEIPVGSTAREASKESPAIAAEVSGGRNWLREYVDRLASSRAMSFRSSGRFLSGRRDLVMEELEANNNRVGEEIGELFRWLSGI